jgi:nitronate monooxygenase
MSVSPFLEELSLPALVAPMFLVSGVTLVSEVCKSGLVGSLPALNLRSTDDFSSAVTDIQQILTENRVKTPFAVNLIVHKTNRRLHPDLGVCVDLKVPIIITSLGINKDVIDTIHGYGGLVFHDVISIRHAKKAADAGVDGIIAVCAGAGGHGGTLNPFAFIPEIRTFFDKTIIVAGCISDGKSIAAGRVLGADLAYMGTRFICTQESLVSIPYKQMILESGSVDILYTDALSGIHGNFLRPSIKAAGLDPENLKPHLKAGQEANVGEELKQQKAWKDIWSAGQGVGSVDQLLSVELLVKQLIADYRRAIGHTA